MTTLDHDSSAPAAPPPFPIVGIGASAGGLEAVSELFDHLAPDLGMGYVLVQHLDPKHESVLATLLAAHTTMPVSQAADGTKVEPNHVYVIPPNTHLAILHGVLHLMRLPETRTRQVGVDYFLRSLAEDQGSRAIGIILSGTASDGALGLKAIKAADGITFAEDPGSARYSGMPQAAVDTGCVDFILAPAAMARELARVGRCTDGERHGDAILAHDGDAEYLNKIFILLRLRTGVDFTHYKHTTIQRRIGRRMLVHRLDRMADYVRLLHERPAEVEVLYNEILINVTSFFRDPEVFDALAREVFPRIMDKCGSGPLRVWVPGCSGGEEAYSLAIAMIEYMEDAGVSVPLQIFATDIDAHAIETARAGNYPESIAADVSPARLERFFTRADHGYLIAQSIRDLCLFAKQDVVKDPPFSRLDLVSCRNLMIYLGPPLQKKALGLFHYALKPGGYLLLGVAETIGKYTDLFRAVDAKHKIYARKTVAAVPRYDFSTPLSTFVDAASAPDRSPGPPPAGRDLSRLVDRTLMKRYCPASVVINEQMDIVQFRGQTGEFLEPAAGEASFHLLRMARSGLAMELREIVGHAIESRAVARKDGIHMPRGGESLLVDIEVSPLELTGSRFFLVVFRASRSPQARAPGVPPGAQQAARVTMLEQELSATKEYLQSMIEQDETINEELRSANEEILSSNEELQSTNEELETAKEELQSLNEELSTVNDELETRNLELTQLNNDLSNLLGSVNVPIVILDADRRIRRITPLAEKQLNLDSGDFGHSIDEARIGIHIPDLARILDDAIDNVSIREVEGQARDGRWFSIRVRPYKTHDNRIEGAIVAFIDIDEMKHSLEIAREARDYAQGIVNAIRHPILVLDGNLKVISVNPAFLGEFRVAAKETVGNLLYHLGNGQWGIPRLRALLEGVCARGESFQDFVAAHTFENIGPRSVHISGRPIDASGKPPFLALMQIEFDVDGAPSSGGA